MKAAPAALAATMLVLFVAPVSAQEPTVITGRVTTSDDGLSVPGAAVSIPALDLSAVADSDGKVHHRRARRP